MDTSIVDNTIVQMDKADLIKKCVAISGLPPRKSKKGHGALKWLSIELDVDYTTVTRWARLNRVPQWAADELLRMERESPILWNEVKRDWEPNPLYELEMSA